MYKFFKTLLLITVIVSLLFLIGLVWSFVYTGPFRESLTAILKLGLLIPFVLLICFLGMNHHKDSDRFKLKPSFYYSFLLVALFGAALTYFKLTKNDFGDDYSASNSQPKDRSNLNSLPKPHSENTSTSEPATSNQGNQAASNSPTKTKETDSVIVPAKVISTNNSAAPATETGKGKQSATETAYEALSKAYVYGEPDEATRKELFIEKQRQSLPLKPRDEKNGFVYVIIPSKGGTVTSGWLRKKDLKKVKVVLDYGKG